MAALVAGSCATASAFVALPSSQNQLRSETIVASASSAPASSASSQPERSSAVGALSAGVFVAAAAAASRTQRSSRHEAAKAITAVRAFENDLGVQAPIGFWDPAGFTADGDPKDFYRRRKIEIKHGRVSMLACVGYIVPEYVKFPGFLSPSTGLKFADIPSGLGALSKVPGTGIFQWVVFCGLCDLFFMHQVPENPPGKLSTRLFGEATTNYEYGAFGIPGYLGGKPIADGELKQKKLNAELANGRLAMMAIMGMFFQDGLTGSAWGDWALFTDSPLRAFENELGAQAPLGFFDPLGLTKDGLGWFQIIAYAAFCEINAGYDADINKRNEPGNMGWRPPLLSGRDPEARKRSLASELANGRLAMMAIMGMLFQDGLTGSAWGDWALYTDSPLRAFQGELFVKAARSSRVKMNIVPSPGFSTLPEFEKPLTGFQGVLGDQAPLGLWDPLGFTKDGNVETFKKRREVEIKHGRVAMFATIGYIVPEYYKFPGFCSPSLDLKFADIPSGLKALPVVPAAGWAQIVAFAGFLELVYNKPTGEPGNYGKGNFGLGSLGLAGSIQDPSKRKQKLSTELANGRLAMMAIIGMFFQDGLTGSAWGDWALYTASPLRAFEGELGVQAPTGFFDPLGFCADGDVESFRNRREAEIKHGRVAMFATIGLITPEFFKFPGYLAPTQGLKFADVPNGLAALGKVPAAGVFQWVALCGLYETCVNIAVDPAEPGNYGKGQLGMGNMVLGITGNKIEDPEKRKRGLNSEIANGRLAMMAVIGLFVQEGLTGSPYGLYTNSALSAFEGELGAQAPLGFFDPLGFCADGDVESFRNRREAEIKHGRVAMFATIGLITPEFFKFPGYLAPTQGLKFADVPNGLAALGKVPAAGVFQWVALCGLYETCVNIAVDPAEPGNYGKGQLGMGNMVLGITGNKIEDPEKRKRGLNSEIANGRLAMMAVIGLFVQEGLTGSPYGLYTNSALSAFEGELGAQAPLGFFDPLGFCADGDVESFRNRREAEIKHGRVAMFATIGLITPEFFKFPGYLAPTQGLKFADVPNGLAALGKVPAAGVFQWVALCGLYETCVNIAVDPAEPGNYGKGQLGMGNMVLGITGNKIEDPEKRKRGLNSEIANGRLAMMAVIGLFVQEGLTGSPYGLYH
ncbi:unnamed protein product [Polarella glacialis]|uniref:Uncharacterized protein n=1 Tax=Polarella glacialis TaxID=89957 RepID=A0A813F3Q7_POLGL|nr:unnamed protein product [Polarella glacialis]